MHLLCFDISSGGITAALLDSHLESIRVAETQWILETDAQGAATLSLATIETQFKRVIQQLNIQPDDRIDALCMDSFMHNIVVLNDADQPLTPVFTWLDQRGESGMEYVRSRMGGRFHEHTGCHYHPMFPVFKLAAMHLHLPFGL